MSQTQCFLLDDDPSFCSGMVEQAAHFGMALDTYYSPLELESVSRNKNYSAGIVDVNLGPIRGPEMLGYLGALFGECPIVYVSGEDESELAKMLHSPSRHYVSKTMGFRKILRATIDLIKKNEGNASGDRAIVTMQSQTGVDVPMFEKKGVLLIDDDTSYRSLLKSCADFMKVPLDCFASLAELGSFARIGEYDLAVVDYFLEGMRGNEIAEYFSVFFKDCPVIIVSANAKMVVKEAHWPNSVKAILPKQMGATTTILEALKIYRESKNNCQFGDGTIASETGDKKGSGFKSQGSKVEWEVSG